jgi:hypothetical protein
MAPQELPLPGTWPTENPRERKVTVDTIRVHPEGSDDTLEAQHSGLERLDEVPHGCMDGWVFLGFEGEDEDGEHVEVIERVPCRRCRPETR